MVRHRSTPALALVAMTLAGLLPAGPAASQPPPGSPTSTAGPTGSPSDQADALYREGVELAKAKEWPRAYPKLLHAYQIKKSFDIASNLGAVEYNLGKYTDAAEHLRYGLSIFPPNAKPEQKKAAEDVFARAKALVGTVRLQVAPADADLKVNNRSVPLDQRAEVFVEAGDVLIEAGAKGHEAFLKTVNVAKGASVAVEVTLKRAAGTGPTASTTATTVPTTVPVSSGPNKILLGTGIGLTAVSLGLGIGLLVGGLDKQAEADDIRQSLIDKGIPRLCETDTSDPDCKKFFDAGDAGVVLGNAGGALLIVGGVAGVATLIYGVVTRSRGDNQPPPVKASFSVGPTSGGVLIQGQF